MEREKKKVDSFASRYSKIEEEDRKIE